MKSGRMTKRNIMTEVEAGRKKNNNKTIEESTLEIMRRIQEKTNIIMGDNVCRDENKLSALAARYLQLLEGKEYNQQYNRGRQAIVMYG